MSNPPFWLPPGATSRTIPVVRFTGVEPGSPEAHHLARAFEPMIRQFYLKMAAQHATGIVDQSRGQRQFGDGLRMQYINQFGQEIIQVTVASIEEVLKQPVVEEIPPDFCVVDFIVPGSTDFEFRMTATLIDSSDPLKIEKLLSSGVEEDYSTPDPAVAEPPGMPVIQWADYIAAEVGVPISNFVGSLKFDFRGRGLRAAMICEIYGQTYPIEEPVPNDVPTFWGRAESTTDYVPNQPIGYGSTVTVSGFSCRNGTFEEESVVMVVNEDYAAGNNPPAPSWFGDETSSGSLTIDDTLGLPIEPGSIGVTLPATYAGGRLLFSETAHRIEVSYPSSLLVEVDNPVSVRGLRWYKLRWNDYRDWGCYGGVDYVEQHISQADVAYAFYWPGAVLEPARLDGYAGSANGAPGAIWVLSTAVLDRAKIGEAMFSEESVDPTERNPEGFPYLGKLTVLRWPPSVEWEPAQLPT